MLRVDVVQDFAKLEELAEDWKHLWQRGCIREVFGMLEWARAWWQAYGRDRELCATVVQNDEKVIGIWPLCSSGKVIRALGMPRSDYIDFLSAPGDAVTVFVASLNALRDGSRKWTRLEIENVPEVSNIARAMGEIPRPWRVWSSFGLGQMCSRIDFSHDPDAVQVGLLENKHLLRKEKRLARFGDVTFRHLESREEIKDLLPEFFDQHIGRRALLGEESLFRHERERFFYRSLVEELDPKRTLRFGVLSVGGKRIAYHLGFAVEGKYVCYKPTFDATYSKWSPGEVLFLHIFRSVASEGLRACDFTVGEEPFKRRFANQTGHNRNLIVCRAGIAHLAEAGWIRMKAAVKEHPGLYQRLKR